MSNYSNSIIFLVLCFLISSCGGGGSSEPMVVAPVTFLVSATADANGTITPASTNVSQNQTAAFTVTADFGYAVSSITGCSGSLIDNIYTTGAITASCTVLVTFSKFMTTVFETTAYEFPHPGELIDNICEEPSSISAYTSILLPIDLNKNGSNDLLVHYWCSPKAYGQFMDAPTADALIAFKNNGDKTFSIANTEIFGSEEVKFGAATRKVVKADFNADGFMDILYALNREDGRAQSDGSTNESPQSAILSKGDGTYTVTDLFFEEWTHAVDAAQLPSGAYDAVISGFRGNTVKGFRYDNGAMTQINDYSSPGGSVDRFGASTMRFFPETIAGEGSKLAISDSTDCGIQVNVSVFSKDSGAWKFVNKTDFKCRTIPDSYESYTGELGDLPLVTIDGQDYTGGGYGNEESCTLELTPGDPRVAVVQFSAQPIEGNYVVGAIYEQGDLQSENRLNFYDVSNEGLSLKKNILVDEKVDDPYRINACRDINNDGYEDIVLLQNAGGGQQTNTRAEPIIYLNNKANQLVRLDLTGIPLVSDDDNYSVHGFLSDLNGDSIEDLVWFRQQRPRMNATDLDPDRKNFIRVHFGLKNIEN
jgi:hypothetical protein